MTRAALLVAGLLTAGACRQAPPPAAALDTRHEMCRTCRMVVSEARVASQVVTPYEEPAFFDNLDCLAAFLKDTPPKSDAVVYVADHRTKAWVRADQAVYTRVDGLALPMGSHVVAHESAASRDADPDAARGVPATAGQVFPGARLPGAS